MPAPASVPELIDLVRKSGVADEAKLRAYLDRQAKQGGAPTDPVKFAQVLVRDGLITFFQAEQLLQGKWKRFTIGKYKVLEKLGAGGMAQVFLCEHKLMRRRVAVKVLPIPKAEDKSSLDRFYREARLVAAVDHPNIVRAYDIDQDENLHFLVMEYVDGINLQDLIKKFGPLDVTRACHYVYGSAVGLQHAHEMGLVHRDIKPGNILIDRSGVVKLLDLGLARFFHDEDDNLTRMNDENVLGTADYLAPEQALDSHTVDIRADLYSLGATFYFLLTGSAPFPEGSVAQKLIWHQSREPRPVQSLRPEVPDGVAEVLLKMMAKDPAKRYQTPAEVMEALGPWVTTPIPPPAEKEMPQLSPAASGAPASQVLGRGTGSGPKLGARVGGGGAPHSISGSPTVIAPGSWAAPSSPAAARPAAAPAADAGGGNGVWESLGDETRPLAGDTGRPGPVTTADPERSARIRRTAGRPASRKTTLLLLAGGLLVLLGGGAVGIWFAFFRKTEPGPGTAEQSGGPRRLVVTKAGGEGTYASVALALKAAKEGDTIAVADEHITEGSIRAHKLRDVTIESGLPGGKAATIDFAPGGGSAVVDAMNADGVRLRNLDLDGKGAAETGASVSGVCPGLTFENVTVRGVKQTGFRIKNAAGDPARPILLDRCRVLLAATNDEAVSLSGYLDTRAVTVRNCRFEGPGKAGVRFDGPTIDVEVSGNRLFNLDAGFVFARPGEGKPVRVKLTGNTGYDLRTGGVVFEFPPAENKGKLEVTISKNYFAKTPNVARSGGPGGAIPGVAFQDNGFGKDSGEGNMPKAAAKVDGPELPAPNPADDAAFLRFPAGGAEPAVGPNKVRVGVN
jgi:serine/threonine protein kinase